MATKTKLSADDGDNSVDVFVRDRDADNDEMYDEPESATTTLVSVGNFGDARAPSLSADATIIAFEARTGNTWNITPEGIDLPV